MNQLNNIIRSGTARKSIYSAFAALGLIYSAIGVAFASLHIADPGWFVAAGAVLVFLGVPTGGLALSNTPITAAIDADGVASITNVKDTPAPTSAPAVAAPPAPAAPDQPAAGQPPAATAQPSQAAQAPATTQG